MAVIKNISKKEARAKAFKNEPKKKTEGDKIAEDLLNHFNRLHAEYSNIPKDYDVEKMLLNQDRYSLHLIDNPVREPNNSVKFNPSGASATDMDLYLKGRGYPEDKEKYPYQARWARNGNAVHDYIQRDLLYAEKFLEQPAFTVEKVDRLIGMDVVYLPAWEDVILSCKSFESAEGYRWHLKGMMDGILTHTKTGRKVGFEFKTKSTTIGQVGNYLMKDAKDYHKEQCIIYSLLFNIEDFIIMYESLAKDGWTKGGEAKPDIRAFHVHVSDEDRKRVVERFNYLADLINYGIPPEDTELGFFSGYQEVLKEVLAEKEAQRDEIDELSELMEDDEL